MSAAQYGAMSGGGTVNEALLARKFVTEWVLIIVYGAPASGTASVAVTFDVTQQRNYHYVAEEHTGLQGIIYNQSMVPALSAKRHP